MVKKTEEKEEVKQDVKDEMWSVQQIPTEFGVGIVKGDVVLDANAALAMALNELQEIRKIVGGA